VNLLLVLRDLEGDLALLLGALLGVAFGVLVDRLHLRHHLHHLLGSQVPYHCVENALLVQNTVVEVG